MFTGRSIDINNGISKGLASKCVLDWSIRSESFSLNQNIFRPQLAFWHINLSNMLNYTLTNFRVIYSESQIWVIFWVSLLSHSDNFRRQIQISRICRLAVIYILLIIMKNFCVFSSSIYSWSKSRSTSADANFWG